jgi:hypothetical protein
MDPSQSESPAASVPAKSWTRRLLAEPFFCFAALGTGFFLAFSYLTREETQIVVTPAVARALYEDSATLVGKAPNPATKDQLLRQYVDDEILFREALQRGLQMSDSKVRARLIELAQVILEGIPADPSEADLASYYAANIDRYRSEMLVTIDVEEILPTGAQSDAAPPRHMENVNRMALRQLYGPSLTARLPEFQPGQWSEPFQSNQGTIRARLIEQKPGDILPYSQVREIVHQDWLVEQNDTKLEAVMTELRGGYRISLPADEK